MNAFWLAPDWSGGDNLRDAGAEPFWMRPPLPAVPPRPVPGLYREITDSRGDKWLVQVIR